MSVGTIITLVLFAVAFAAMFRMHRGGGHAHGMGGCGGHGAHGGHGTQGQSTPDGSLTQDAEATDARVAETGRRAGATGSRAHEDHGTEQAAGGSRHRGC